MYWTDLPLRIPGLPAEPGVDAPKLLSHDQHELLEELWARPETLALPIEGGKALVDADGRLALIPPSVVDEALARGGEDSPLRLYLGRVRPVEGIPDDGILVAGGPGNTGRTAEVARPVVGVLVSEPTARHLAVGEWLDLRQASLRLKARDAGLLTRAVALANWHASHRFSPRTGRETTPVLGGWARKDVSDGSEHFPRTDPAVIIAVTDDADRILLASNAAWDERVFSLIAGFVDPGESLEQAVIREVYEEANVRVRDPKYLGSQPWPFPASLMLGFHASVVAGGEQAAPDGVEIRSLRWFSRRQLNEAIETGEVIVPGPGSISHAIIASWHGDLPASQ